MPVEVVGFTVPDFERSLGAFIRKVTIETAEQALREEVGRGFDSQPVVVTDGMPRRDYRGVKIGGRIEFIRRPQMADAVLWALDELRKRSPVLTGRYVSSHIVMINGAEIAGDVAAALRNVKETDRVQIANTQPYARKIEGATASKRTGRGKRKPSSKQAKGGVYRVVVRGLVQRYGRSMFFDYKMVKLNLGVRVWGDQGGRYNRHGVKGKARRVLRDQVYPAVQFFIKPTGPAN